MRVCVFRTGILVVGGVLAACCTGGVFFFSLGRQSAYFDPVTGHVGSTRPSTSRSNSRTRSTSIKKQVNDAQQPSGHATNSTVTTNIENAVNSEAKPKEATVDEREKQPLVGQIQQHNGAK